MKVLFLGNSHTYMNDMPRLFQMVCEASTGESAQVAMLAYSGRELKWHRAEYFSLRFALLYGGFDYCVIQQAAHPFPPEEETLSAGGEIADMCRQAGVTPVWYMTWAEKRFPENQQKMIDTYRKLHALHPSILAPVGEIWRGLLSSHPEIDLFYQDGEHASPYGDLLIAATICAAVTGKSDLRAPDRLLNFGVEFGDPQHPAARMDRDTIEFPADPDKVEAILYAVRAHYGK